MLKEDICGKRLHALAAKQHEIMATVHGYVNARLRIETVAPTNYVVGIGSISDRLVAVGGEDFTLKGGSPNASGLRKSIYAEHLAVKHRIPLVKLLEGGGGSIESGTTDPKKPRTVGNPVYEEPRFAVIAQAMGIVPVVSQNSCHDVITQYAHSCIETSINWPSPVFSRWLRAIMHAAAASAPPCRVAW